MSEPRRNPVDELAEEFVERYRRGERPALTEYTQKHPELAEEIRELFPALAMIEEAGPGDAEPVLVGSGTITADGRPLKQLGDYRIVRQIGRGGMGVVFEAVQEALGRHVALKVLPLAFSKDPTHLKRFRREARSAARLHHTNIVPVFDVGECQGIHYYAMQFIQGQGLDEVLHQLRRMRRLQHLGKGDSPALSNTAPYQLSEPEHDLSFQLATGLRSGQFRRDDLYEECRENGKDAHSNPPLSGRVGQGEEPAKVVPGDFPQEPLKKEYEEPSFADSSSSPITGSSEFSVQSEYHFYRSVAQVGLQVAEALAYAHGLKVLHRDIKPSNLLLDRQGTVWVTDFGLAKEEEGEDLTQTGDIVGTLRYMAPERFSGRADPRSDIYGLGTTLYELVTLQPVFEERDRARLIHRIAGENPVRPRKVDPHIPRDLETIVCKAIAKEPKDRYATAETLADDLRRFLGDRPIRARRTSVLEQCWRWRRRNKGLAAMTGFALLLLAMIFIGTFLSWIQLRGEQTKTVENLHRAEGAEEKKTAALYRSYLNQAQAQRLTGLAGQSFKSLEWIELAIGLRPPEKITAEETLRLRNEAIACLATPDLRVVQEQDPGLHWGGGLGGFDHLLERYTRAEDRQLVICRLGDNRVLDRLPPPPGLSFWYIIARFSPDDRFLAVKYRVNQNIGTLVIWDLTTRQSVLRLDNVAGFDFHPASLTLAAKKTPGNIHFYQLPQGTEKNRLERMDPGYEYIRFDPHGKGLACASEQGVEIIDVETGKTKIAFPPLAQVPEEPDWSPDSRWLAVPSLDHRVYVYDMVQGRLQSVLAGHKASVIGVAFRPTDNLLASASFDNTTKLWDPVTGKQLVSALGLGFRFSADGQRLAFVKGSKFGSWEVADGRVCRTLHHGAVGNRTPLPNSHGPLSLDFGKHGRLLASSSSDGVRLWDTRTLQELAHLKELGYTRSVLFDPKDKGLVSYGPKGLYYWPLHEAGNSYLDGLRIGPPQIWQPTNQGPQQWLRASWDHDGKWLAVTDSPHERAVVLSRDTPARLIELRNFGPQINEIALSPNGKWAAATAWVYPGVRVWETNTGTTSVLPGSGPNANARALAFSPDNQWLVVGSAVDYRWWRVGSWTLGPVITRDGEEPGMTPLAFSADGAMLAICRQAQAVQLVDPVSGREFATLTPPDLQIFSWLAFSPDGSQLAAATDDHVIHLWDLRLLRQKLAALHLEGDLPPISPPQNPDNSQPLQAHIDRGTLIWESSPNDPDRLRQEVGIYSFVLSLNPFNFQAYRKRGDALRRLGEYAKALDDLSIALVLTNRDDQPRLDADLAEACNELAWDWATGRFHLFDPQQILGLAQKAVELAPDNWKYLWTYRNTLGVVYYRLGRYSEAQQSLQQSIRDRKDEADAFNLFFLAMCYHRLRNPAKARDCYDRAVLWVRDYENKLPVGGKKELKAFRIEAEELLVLNSPQSGPVR